MHAICDNFALTDGIMGRQIERLVSVKSIALNTRVIAVTHCRVERNRIRTVLETTEWRVRGIEGAAERLGLRPTTLETRMAKLGLTLPTGGIAASLRLSARLGRPRPNAAALGRNPARMACPARSWHPYALAGFVREQM